MYTWGDNMETKICSVCKKELSINMFNKMPSGKNGLNNKCKECITEYGRQRHIKNKEKDLEYGIQYYKENKEKLLQYRIAHKEKIKKYNDERNAKKIKSTFFEDNRKQIEDSLIEKYKNEFYLLTPYVNIKTQVLISCIKCGYKKSITGHTLNHIKQFCTVCKKAEEENKRIKSIEEKEKLNEIHRVEKLKKDTIMINRFLASYGYQLLGKFEKNNIPIATKHSKCGHIWLIRMNDFVKKGVRCPQCYIAETCKKLNMPIESWGNGENRHLGHWSIKVRKRDNNKCVICGSRKNLNAHHLNGWKWDIKNRTKIDNGVTLCEKCHHKFHDIYGWGGNTKEQFKEYEKPKQLAFAL